MGQRKRFVPNEDLSDTVAEVQERCGDLGTGVERMERCRNLTITISD